MYAILNNYIKQEQYDEYVYALEIILNILISRYYYDNYRTCYGYDMGMYFILARI